MTNKGYKQTEEHKRKIRDSLKMFTKEQDLQICKWHVVDKLSTYTLAKKMGCSYVTIRNTLKRNGMNRKYKFTKEQDLQICKWYIEDKLSTYEIAKKLNCYNVIIQEALKRNNIKRRTKSEASGTPRAIQRALKNGYGTNCYYHYKLFPSLQERDCYIYLIKLGYIVIHNFLGRFDFLVIKNNKKVVVEFHSYDRNGLTNRQYYYQRRKLLNKYGYKNLKLVVVKDLKEIESKLVKAGAK